jgi:hypothetical protein
MRSQLIGYAWPPFDVVIERGPAIAFARGLDETNPVYFSEAAAREAGLRGIAVLPTFPIAMSTERVDLIYDMLRRLSIDPAQILHASQRFVYHQALFVGDRLTGSKRLTNIADRKNGALTFIDTVIEYRNTAGDPVCEDHCSLVARNT